MPESSIPPGQFITEDERMVLDALTIAWHRFLALEPKHPDDNTEFRQAIHAAQNLIAWRVARRVDPDIWS